MNDFDNICNNISKKVKFDILPQSCSYQQFVYSLYVYLHTFVLKLALIEPMPNNGMSEFFVKEQGLESFIPVLIEFLKTRQNLTLRDIYVLAYTFMKKKMTYNFPKTIKNKLKNTFIKFITRDPMMAWNFHLLFGKFADDHLMYQKNNTDAISDLKTVSSVLDRDLSYQEMEIILNKYDINNILKSIYSVFMVPQYTDFAPFTEEDKKTYQELIDKVNKIRAEIKNTTGTDSMHILVGYIFSDIDSKIVDVICKDADFKICYHVALGIKIK